MKQAKFSHVDAAGLAKMVAVSEKMTTLRRAVAIGNVVLNEEIFACLTGKELHTKKGAVFQTAILAGIMAAKRVHELIPLCHLIPLGGCDIVIEIIADYGLQITATVSAQHKTGVEMEALTAVSVAALTIYDMCKGISQDMQIQNIRLLEKSGGKKDYQRQGDIVDGLTVHERIVMNQGIGIDVGVPAVSAAPSVPAVSAASAAPAVSAAPGVPAVYGLILAGGKSRRMQRDKIFLQNKGTTQYELLLQILQGFCSQVFVSCRSDQMKQFKNPLTDRFLDMGPLSGILSAFRTNPNVAWLTIASDQFLLNTQTISKLVSGRHANSIATCFFNSETQAPEPLLTIWEPRAYRFLLKHLATNKTCPRSCLIRYRSRVTLLHLADESPLCNANTPDAYARLMAKNEDLGKMGNLGKMESR